MPRKDAEEKRREQASSGSCILFLSGSSCAGRFQGACEDAANVIAPREQVVIAVPCFLLSGILENQLV